MVSPSEPRTFVFKSKMQESRDIGIPCCYASPAGVFASRLCCIGDVILLACRQAYNAARTLLCSSDRCTLSLC